jgi:hypothetical protein
MRRKRRTWLRARRLRTGEDLSGSVTPATQRGVA